MYEGIFADVEKVKQILASHGHKPVDRVLIFELLEDLQQTDRVVRVLLGSSPEKSDAERNSDSLLRTDSSCDVSELYSGFEKDTDDVLMNSSYSDEIPREAKNSKKSISSYHVPNASISVDLTSDDSDETSQHDVIELSKLKTANKLVAKADSYNSVIAIKDALSQTIDLTKQYDTVVKEESCQDTDTDIDLVRENKHNDADVTSLGSDSDTEMDDYYEDMLLDSEDSNEKHSPLPLLSPTALRATSSPHFLNRLDDLVGPEQPTHRVDEMLEENNNDPNNNLEDIQIMEQNNSSSLTSDDVISKEDPHLAPCTFHSNFPKSIDEIHDSPKPGCSKDSYFDDVPAASHTENAANNPIETVDMRKAESAITTKRLDAEVTGNSEEEMLVNSLETDALNIKEVLPDISLLTIKRNLQANKNAINRVALCLWDLLPNERPSAILSGKRTSETEDCPISQKKKYIPVEARDEAGQFKEIGSTDNSKVDCIDTDNVLVCTSRNNEVEKHGNVNMTPIDNPTQKDVSSNSCLSYVSTELTPLQPTQVHKGINYSNEATVVSDKITGSEDSYDCDDDTDPKYKHSESSIEGETNEGHHDETNNFASTSNGFSNIQCVGSKVKLKPSKLNHVVGCRPSSVINNQPLKSSPSPVYGSFKLNHWRSSAEKYSQETNNAELKQNNVPFDPTKYFPADEFEHKYDLVDPNIVTDVDKQLQTSQLESETQMPKLKINMKPSSFHIPKESGETRHTTSHTKEQFASTSSQIIQKPTVKLNADMSGADIERRYQGTKVVTNAATSDIMNPRIGTSVTSKPTDQKLIQPGKLNVQKSTQSSNPVISNALSVAKNGETTRQNNLGAVKKPPPKSTIIDKMLELEQQARLMRNIMSEHIDTVNNLVPRKNKQIISKTSISLDKGVRSTTSKLSANSNIALEIGNKANDTMLLPKQNEQNIHSRPISNDKKIGTVINDPSAHIIELVRLQNLIKQLSGNSNIALEIGNKANDTMLLPKQNEQNIHSRPISNDKKIATVINDPSAHIIELVRLQNLIKQLSGNSNIALEIGNKANDTMLLPKQNEQNIHSRPISNDKKIATVINDPSASSIESVRIAQNLLKQMKNSDKAISNSTVADNPVTSDQSIASQASSSSSKFQTTTLAIEKSSSLNLDPPRELFNPLINMFPDVNPNYIASLCIKGKQENRVLETLVEHLLQTGIRHPRIVNPEPEPAIFTADEQYENLQGIFPDAHPEYLRNFAESNWNNPEAMKTFVEQRLEDHDYPTMAAYLEKVKITEQIRRYTVDFDVKNFLEIFPDPFAHFENPARVYKFNVFAFDFLKRHFNGIKVATIQKVYSYSNNRYHISLAAKELESIRKDMKSRRADKPIAIEDIPLLQEFAFIRNKNEIRHYMLQQKKMEEQEFEKLKKDNQLFQCQCCFDDECMPSKCFTCTEGHIFCKPCILLGTQTKIGEGQLEFPCFTSCSGEFSLEVLQKVVTPTTFSILLRKKQEAEVKAAGLEGLVSCPFCHFASIPPPEDRIFKCLNPDCMKETCRLCKELNHVPLRCDEVIKGEEARHYLEEKMTAALVRKCYHCSRTFFKEEGCNKMTCPCGASMCYICGQPVKDYKHFNGQGSDRVDLCPLWSDNALMNAKAVRASAEAVEKELRTQNPNLKIDAKSLMPELPTPTNGPHQNIANAHVLPAHAQNRGHANVLR